MRIVFRVDASSSIGSGHVMRCLTLAQVFKDNCSQVEFLCREHKGNLVNKINQKGFNVRVLKTQNNAQSDFDLSHSSWLEVSQKQDAIDCINELNKMKKIDWVVVDHYALDQNWEKMIQPICNKIFVIDDLADRKHACNVLLDQNFGRDKKDYKGLVPSYCKLLMGSKYALLRPEFLQWRPFSLNRRTEPILKSLLINFGGIDNDNLTEQVLRRLNKCNLPIDIKIIVVMGVNNSHLNSVINAANDLTFSTEIKIDVDNLAEIMANVDLAIGASGSTSLERCCLGLPSIQIPIAENQIFLAKKLHQFSDILSIESVSEIEKILNSPFDNILISDFASAEICDGEGVRRVFNRMTDYQIYSDKFGEVNLINYINLSLQDKKNVLDMRNHENISKWMYNQSKIPLNTHIDFIDGLEKQTNLRYFIVKQNEKLIGAINFSKIIFGKSANFGIFVNPFEKIRGSGKILEYAGTQYAYSVLGVKKIDLEVFSENDKAVNFYLKSGFEVIKKITKESKNIIQMQKKSK